MLNRKILFMLLLFQVFSTGSKLTPQKQSFLIKLVNQTQATSNRFHKTVEMSHEDVKCKYKCLTANELGPKYVNNVQARFIDQGTNDSLKDKEMEAPSAKFSILNLLSDDEEEEEEEEEDLEADDGDESVKDDEDGSEDDDFNFFGTEEADADKLEDTKDESYLKQYNRHTLRMHNLVFPLLLAYKLKFFTVIPLLLGTLVLLVGTTGVAGFFFALFAAALAIHSKSNHH